MSTHWDLRHLRAFVAVAEELHFTRAAEKLHFAQQALSVQIRQLEASLGVELFDRTTRRVELTEAGRVLLAHAEPLLTAASQAWEEVLRVGSGEAGPISISYIPSARREILPVLLAEVGHRLPGLEVHSCEILWGDSPVTEEFIDVAITRSPPPADDHITSVRILETPLGLVLGSQHPLADGTVAPEKLQKEALKIFARSFSPGFHDVIVSALTERGFAGPVEELGIFGSSQLLDDPAACDEIAAGRAFGFGFPGQYTSLPQDLVWKQIEPVLSIPLYLVWPRNARPAVQNFVAVTLEVARAQRWLPRRVE